MYIQSKLSFHFDKIYPNLIPLSNVALTSDPTVTADGPMARASPTTERILGERTEMCTQQSSTQRIPNPGDNLG